MPEIPLYPYQEEGVHFLASRQRALLLDVPGLGKTSQAIRALDLAGLHRGIVVVPAMVRENWCVEFERFARVRRRICKALDIHDFTAWLKRHFDVLVMSYEQATKWGCKVSEPLDFLIVDEAHYTKNPNTARTRALFGTMVSNPRGGLSGWCGHVWLLTGTPWTNDPLDIYTLLRVGEAIHGTRPQFCGRYFIARRSGAGKRHLIAGPKQKKELRKLLGSVALRRTKDDVGLQLPPIRFFETLLDGDTRPILDLLVEHPDLEDAIMAAVRGGSLSFISAPWVAMLRRLVGIAKSVPYSAMLKEELRPTMEKRVVFGLHREALRTVHKTMVEAGIGSRLVIGGTSESKRVEAVDSFQNDPECRVFVANMRAAGTGLTLTSACELDVLESDWVPANNAQAIMRVHRIGQERNVSARFLTLAKSIDVRVNKVVASKAAAIAGCGDSELLALTRKHGE